MVDVGSTVTVINWANSSPAYEQGTLTFTTGVNSGVTANIKSATSSNLTLGYPLPSLCAPGDAFLVYQGCDHTRDACQSKFSNLANFRGFPFVPPPTYAV